ncbi:MAG: polysaccharide deacetylase family protein, partial [Acidobacteria bacterium]|nr:polysaccharide deacetylase family protein [Acidobacteriota bacterium]
VWMLDGVTGYNQLRAAELLGVRGTALWRLGAEDPSLWFIWDATHPSDSVRAQLEQIPPGPDLILEDDGDIWRIMATPQKGQRTFRYDSSTDSITDESFTIYPLSYRIDHLGNVPNKIALTFDDGPDPRFTPQILDILKEKHVSATFFVTGLAANNAPDIVRRAYAEGNEIGNHTYTHSHFDEGSATQLTFELKLTERLLESFPGVKTLLFRPPYGVDHQPESADEVALLPLAQGLGCIIVGARIDPQDWGELNGGSPPPAATIVSRVLAQAGARKGNTVLLHDSGGDRSQTVAALPQIIDGLRAKGFQLVSVSELLGKARAEVMPPPEPRRKIVRARRRLHIRPLPLVAMVDRQCIYNRDCAGQW